MKKTVNLNLDDLDGVSGGAGVGSVVSSGSFKSNTGTGLNIEVQWQGISDSMGGKRLELHVFAQSYSLSSIALENAVTANVGGAVYAASSAAVNYSGKAMTSSPLASFSLPNVSGNVPVTVSWCFNGTYSGVTLTEIQASGRVVL